MLNIICIHNEPIDEITYILYKNEGGAALIIDPFEIGSIKHKIQAHSLVPEWIILTHEHYDHIGAVNQLKEIYHAKICCSSVCASRIASAKTNLSSYFNVMLEMHDPAIDYDKVQPYEVHETDLKFNDRLTFGWQGEKILLTETPGHSPGSICIQIEDILFSGDSLLKNTPVSTKLPGGSRKAYEDITEPFLQQCDKNLLVYPGHGESFRLDDNKFL